MMKGYVPMSKPVVELEKKAVRPPSSARYILVLLFIANLLNFYDRALPATLLEPIKKAFGLDDTQVGILASAFVIVAAIAGIPLGRLADRIARKSVIGWGLLLWSIFTALGGLLTSFWGFFATRVGVGVGEASFDPATGSLVSDLYPAGRRARATALYTLGFPIGTFLAYITAGSIAVAFNSWRAPFLLAAIPGVIIAVLVLRLREPKRGAADVAAANTAAKLSFGKLLRIPSLYGLIVAFAGYNFAAYAIGTFLTPVLQRYYGLSLVTAGLVSGVVIGIAGLIGLILGGRLLDRAAKRSVGTRVLFAALSLIVAAPLALLGFAAGPAALGQLVLFLSLSYLFGTIYLASAIPAVADVIKPEQRSSALGIIFALGYLLGGAGGPIAIGALSDSLTKSASGLSASAASAQGLQGSMLILVPIGFLVAGLGMLVTSRTIKKDHAATQVTELPAQETV
jgi:MFS transporter, Spinster family, sphingosine-1-phosphate transporter